MKQVLLAGLLMVTAACGAYALPGSSPSPSTGTISGKAVSVPCAPVEQAGTECGGRPVAGLEIDFACGSAAAAKATTDSSGAYSARVTPGTCTVKFPTTKFLRYLSGPQKITVKAGDSITANYVFDNGIRVPVPQQ